MKCLPFLLTLFLLLAGAFSTGTLSAQELPADIELSRLRKQAEAHPESHMDQLLLGKALYEAGQTVEAVKVLQKALEIPTPPKDVPLSLIMTNLGQCLEREGYLRSAINVYNTALNEQAKESASPNTPAGYGKEYREALQGYHDRAQASKDKATNLFKSAQGLLQSGKRDEALVELGKCLALAADFTDVWRFQGEVLAESGRHPQAAASFQRAIDFFPRDDESLALLGRSLMEMRQDAEAFEAFKKALAINPENDLAKAGLLKTRPAAN